MDIEKRVRGIKEHDYYHYFTNHALDQKKKNEEEAKLIILANKSNVTKDQVTEIVRLVNEPYTAEYPDQNFKRLTYPWFAQLKSGATKAINTSDDVQIEKWFSLLLSGEALLDSKIDTLADTHNPLHLDGASVGLITLILYLIDKEKYSIWFKSQHEALKNIYPSIGGFKKSDEKYKVFNKTLKDFANKFNFCNSELDFVLYLSEMIYSKGKRSQV